MCSMLSACSRLSSLARVQPQAPSVTGPRRRLGTLPRRGIYVRISPSLEGLLALKAFHSPDEENPHLAECHLSFAPGEVFAAGDDEYRIERKLRGRMTSMVWLATHTNKRKPARDGPSFVALEMFDSLFSATLTEDPRHNPDLRHIHTLKARQNAGVPGSQYCERAIRVSVGPHLCIAKEPCGPTLAALQETQPHRSFALPVTKRIVRQTLLALSFIHTTMKRTHIGVNPHNISVALLGSKQDRTANIQAFLDSNPPKMAYRSIWDRLRWWSSSSGACAAPRWRHRRSPPSASPPLSTTSRSGWAVATTRDRDLERLAAHEAMDGDGPFVAACNMLHAPLLLAAPEALWGFPGPYSPPINIWAVGHLLFQCLTGEVVYTKRIERTGRDVAFPDFNEMYALCDPRVLEKRLRSFAHVVVGGSGGGGGGGGGGRGPGEMRERDVQATCALLARCFDPDPAARPTAKQLLKDEWFRS